MFIIELKSLKLAELKQEYSNWLNTQNLSPNTIKTSKMDAFYVLKHNPNFNFWRMIESENFEEIAKSVLEDTLTKYSKGNVKLNINAYLAHLRRFRRFAYSGTKTTINQSGKVLRAKKYVEIPDPTCDEVEQYLGFWNTMENYRLQEKALDKLFVELSPHNDDLSDILIKASTLNDFYSTNIYSIFPVAKHILSLDIDERLNIGDETLINDIKMVEIGGKVKNFYSFATKYCSHHRPLDYPIYDSYVDKVLRYFRDKDGFVIFDNKDLKKFPEFKFILEQFRIFYGLDKYTLKQLDQYIWLLGKKFFSKN